MRKKYIGYGIWLVLAACLYFFENNTGSRIILCGSLLILPIPGVRRLFLLPDHAEVPRRQPVTVKSFSYPEEEDTGGVRVYQPGDPVNRIHWKLSAGRDKLLIRETGREPAPEEDKKQAAVSGSGMQAERRNRRQIQACITAAVLLMLCLAGIPGLRSSAGALCNRLFDASERVNAYVYDRFPVPAGQPAWPAALCLALMLALILGTAVLAGSRVPAVCLMAGLIGFQVYFGLAFSGWINVALFTAFALRMAGRPRTRRGAATILAAILAVSLAVIIGYPGVDTATETASEQARDALSRLAQQTGGTVREETEGETETRRIHSRTLITGDQEADAEKEYRLETVEEEQISIPKWINYLKIALLLLATAALAILPFLPFLILNARKKKAAEARKVFMSADVREAICAAFQQVVMWLEATGHGAGNLPYRLWARDFSGPLSPEYARRFSLCAGLFEEAAYSCHPMEEGQRQQVLSLLEETERRLIGTANLKQKIRLKAGGVWMA